MTWTQAIVVVAVALLVYWLMAALPCPPAPVEPDDENEDSDE